MSLGLLKNLLKPLWYRPGTTHRILLGPLKGLRFRFSRHTGFAALYSGSEQYHCHIYREVLKQGDFAIDAGANWGVHSMLMALLVGPTGRVVAFEPNQEVAQELAYHLQINGLHQARQEAFALYDATGRVHFMEEESSSISHVAREDEIRTGGSEMVDAITLDDWMARHEDDSNRRLKLIKIDVEGSESRVLNGAKKTIEKHQPHLVIELHTPEQDAAVARFLLDGGYRFRRVDGSEIKNPHATWPDPDGVWGTIVAEPVSFEKDSRHHSTGRNLPTG